MGEPSEAGPLQWARPYVADAVLAVAVAGVQVLLLSIATDAARAAWTPVETLTFVLIAAQAAPLVARRPRPLLVFFVVLAPNTLYYVRGYPPSGLDLALAVALYTVSSRCNRRVSVLCCGAILVVCSVLWVLQVGPYWSRASLPLFIYLLVFFSAAWAWGRYHRARQQVRDAHVNELMARAEQAERDREAATRQILADERNRIARELHDSIAHHMSVMVVQAGAARRVLDADPDAARAALRAVEEAGRRGMSTIPSLVRALRGGGGATELSPQPSLTRLDDMVGLVRAAGLPVSVQVEGCPRPLPPAVEMSAYRVTQEALTNVLKHAGPARARVCLRYGSDDLEVTVTDDGWGARAAGGQEGGHGLVGMRERVAVLGGDFEAVSPSTGGFRVRARFPAVRSQP
jgi:signal transduction histidine kinase